MGVDNAENLPNLRIACKNIYDNSSLAEKYYVVILVILDKI